MSDIWSEEDKRLVEKETKQTRRRYYVRLIGAAVLVVVAWGLVMYILWGAPNQAKTKYELLVHDLEWRRAKLELPYRQVQSEMESVGVE